MRFTLQDIHQLSFQGAGGTQAFDRARLIGLVQSLYGASKENQVFLHARFGLGDDVLKPY